MERNAQTVSEALSGWTQRVLFVGHPDITYLTSQLGAPPKVIGRMLRIFGAAVVTEALRRSSFASRFSSDIFYRICQEVERDAPR